MMTSSQGKRLLEFEDERLNIQYKSGVTTWQVLNMLNKGKLDKFPVADVTVLWLGG